MTAVLLMTLLLTSAAGLFVSCGRKDEGITSIDQLKEPGVKIGVASDTTEFRIVEEEFPEAEIVYVKDDLSAYTGVAQGKIDAFVYNRLSMQTAIDNGFEGVRLLDVTIGEPNVGAVAISPETEIPDLKGKINEFIAEMEDNGTMDDVRGRWLERHEQVMPDIPEAEDPKLHLVVGTTGNNAPFTYFIDGELAGYDIELAERFASWLGASLEFKVYDYEGIVSAAQGGDVDCIFANLFVTPERQQAVEFSDPTFIGDIGVMVKDTESPPETETERYSSLADFSDKRIGACTGTIQGAAVERELPDAEVSYYNTHTDCLAALRQGKIDGFADSDIVIRYLMIDNSDLTYLEDYLTEPVEVGAIFSKTEKGDRIRGEFNEYLKKIKENGTLEELDGIWYGQDAGLKKVKDPSKLSAENGVLRLATDTSLPPVSYVGENQVIGFDIDIATRFCDEYGYGLEIVDTSFPSIVNAVATENCDFGIGGIGITEERAESVNFSDTMYSGNSVIAYLKDERGSGGFLSSLKESFNKTFVRESRWKLFLKGIGTTLLITVLSIIFGTLIGFAVYMLCRRGNRVANTVTRFCVWLIQGTPVVVLLMILYYIVFSKARLSGVAVSVIAFTLIFAAAVFGMLKAGVAAVGTGQMEAAYSLGYRDRKAFYRIILPQALPHIMPSYKTQITALIKATAVVGYVAVQDLTKMGDIVRSRTYEAFFPLIAVAVMYFVLAAVLTFIVNKIEVRTVPQRKQHEDVQEEADQA